MVKHASAFTQANALAWNPQTLFRCQCTTGIVAQNRTNVNRTCIRRDAVLSFHPVNGDGYPERSLYDFRHTDGGSMLRVKGQDGFCPLGPVLVDAKDVDPNDLVLRTYVNGKVVQEGHTKDGLMVSFAYLIADLARLITLEPGDVLLTGTPANSRPVEIGDVVAVEVEGIGRLENTVVELDRDLVEVGAQPIVSVETLSVALALSVEQAKQELQSREQGNPPQGSRH